MVILVIFDKSLTLSTFKNTLIGLRKIVYPVHESSLVTLTHKYARGGSSMADITPDFLIKPLTRATFMITLIGTY
jgi:hypothetical protein